EPCRLNCPEVNTPEANSLSLQDARVTAPPMPSTRPPASTARILRLRVDRGAAPSETLACDGSLISHSSRRAGIPHARHCPTACCVSPRDDFYGGTGSRVAAGSVVPGTLSRRRTTDKRYSAPLARRGA